MEEKSKVRKPRAASETISIRILDWAELTGGSSKRLHYVRFPLSAIVDQRFAMKAELFALYWRLVAVAGQSISLPGAVHGTVHSVSTACRCKPVSLLSGCRRLQDLGFIQIVASSEVLYSEYRRVKEEERKEGHSVFPSWVFDQAGMQKRALGEVNPFLTREIFGQGIFQHYVKPDVEAFDRIYDHVAKIVYDEKWLAFIQTCLRNYGRRKREESERPVYHNMSTYFFQRDWWNDFRKDNGTIPKFYNGSGALTARVDDEGNTAFIPEHNISNSK